MGARRCGISLDPIVQLVQLSQRISTSSHVLFCLLYTHTNDDFFDDFPKISEHFPKISEEKPMRSFSVSTNRLWNMMPAYTKTQPTLTSFKKCIVKHFMDSYRELDHFII